MKIKDKITGITLEFDTTPTQQEARARFDAEAGKSKDVGILEAILPRTTQAEGFSRKAAGVLPDIASLPGRYSAAEVESPRRIFPKAEDVARTRGEDLIDEIVRDPRTGAVAAAAPFTGGLSALGLKGAVKAGAIEGGAAALTGEAQRFSEEGVVSPKAAGIETILNALFPLIPAGLKHTGKGIVRPILKPKDPVKRSLKKKGLDLGEDIFGPVFRKKVTSPLPFHGRLKAIENRILEAEKATNNDFTAIVNLNKDVDVDVRDAYHAAVEKLNDEMLKGKHFDVSDKLGPVIERWRKKITREGKGFVKLNEAINLRKSLDKVSNWEFKENASKGLIAEARFARAFRRSLNETQIHAKVPDLMPVDQSLSHGYPIKNAVEDAVERVGNNNALSLTDIIILTGAAGVLGASQKIDIPGAEAGGGTALSLFLLNRLRRSPTTAAQLVGASKLLETPMGRQAIMRPVSSGSREYELPQRKPKGVKVEAFPVSPREAAIERARGAGL